MPAAAWACRAGDSLGARQLCMTSLRWRRARPDLDPDRDRDHIAPRARRRRPSASRARAAAADRPPSKTHAGVGRSGVLRRRALRRCVAGGATRLSCVSFETDGADGSLVLVVTGIDGHHVSTWWLAVSSRACKLARSGPARQDSARGRGRGDREAVMNRAAPRPGSRSLARRDGRPGPGAGGSGGQRAGAGLGAGGHHHQRHLERSAAARGGGSPVRVRDEQRLGASVDPLREARHYGDHNAPRVKAQ